MKRRRGLFLITLAAALACLSVVALCVGAVKIPPGEVLEVLSGRALDPKLEDVVWQLRVPRVLLGIMVGAALSVAGALMQGLFRNPLADPGLIGISSGAALGAVFVITLGRVVLPEAPLLSDMRLLPVSAFLGALVVALFVQRLAATSGYTSVATVLLVGIAVNSLASAVIGLSTFLATDTQLRALSFWMLGSLGAADWKMIGVAAPFCLGLTAAAPLFAPALNAFALGGAEAGHLGYSIERTKKLLILITTAGVGACVAFTGLIGFVGRAALGAPLDRA